ncbi:Flp family type IVb pilin [Qipengyuania sp. DSG2-2]|uniref:Flp family type IVb pilin n=1 Tax=Qipengyuania sp. DGS2-2 TaxID=3349631 RepID=UPI0036D30C69
MTDRSGATAIEYGLILALVFLTMIGAVTGVGTETIDMWDDVSEEVSDARGS